MLKTLYFKPFLISLNDRHDMEFFIVIMFSFSITLFFQTPLLKRISVYGPEPTTPVLTLTLPEAAGPEDVSPRVEDGEITELLAGSKDAVFAFTKPLPIQPRVSADVGPPAEQSLSGSDEQSLGSSSSSPRDPETEKRETVPAAPEKKPEGAEAVEVPEQSTSFKAGSVDKQIRSFFKLRRSREKSGARISGRGEGEVKGEGEEAAPTELYTEIGSPGAVSPPGVEEGACRGRSRIPIFKRIGDKTSTSNEETGN